jgi:co-chaperonin GroES (HSP10)
MQTVRTQVLVRQIAPETTTAGGLILTQNHATTYGEVVSVGSEADKTITVGARIVLNWNAAVQIKHENDTYYCVDHSQVYLVV